MIDARALLQGIEIEHNLLVLAAELSLNDALSAHAESLSERNETFEVQRKALEALEARNRELTPIANGKAAVDAENSKLQSEANDLVYDVAEAPWTSVNTSLSIKSYRLENSEQS